MVDVFSHKIVTKTESGANSTNIVVTGLKMLSYRVYNTFLFCSIKSVEHFRWDLTGGPRRLEKSNTKSNVDYGGTAQAVSKGSSINNCGRDHSYILAQNMSAFCPFPKTL